MADIDDADDGPQRMGRCCGCLVAEAGLNVVMLNYRAPIPGHGWGCMICNLPPDGALAVLCDHCTDRLERGFDAVRFACVGFPGADQRVLVDTLTEAFDHDPAIDHG
jgi:hypothetical protein